MVIDCNLHIDGEFEGVIRSKNSVTIGKSGGVGGEIYAEKLVVSGKFTGSCDCDVIEIMPQGRIDGQITTKELVIERKGYFVGESKIKEDGSKFGTLSKIEKAEKADKVIDPK